MQFGGDMDFEDRLSHLLIIKSAGIRDGRRPQFLSENEFICPNCGYPEYANVEEKKVKMCSRCLMNEALKIGREERDGKSLLKDEQAKRICNKKPIRICERCGDQFQGMSNSQKYCKKCRKWAEKEKTRERVRRFREKPLVTV